MMNWANCYSDQRSGMSKTHDMPRTEYQRDFDRLIFASSFRRLQNKTQVFPLPGSTFVHNRLTHSLEVASVGRSLGKIVGDHIAQDRLDQSDTESRLFYNQDLSSVIGSACLAHDIGNPAFGHSGEKALSNYFITNRDTVIGDKSLSSYFNDVEWLDLTNFEGNANAIRVLTHAYRNKPKGGLRLTYSTLAAVLKYPCESSGMGGTDPHRKKYGFFQTERETFQLIAENTNMHIDCRSPLCYQRHPFVYLVEAADDICYRIVDLEDAHRLGIVSRVAISKVLLDVLSELKRSQFEIDSIKNRFSTIQDSNDSIAYLRAKTINALTLESADIFISNNEAILNGRYNSTLIDDIEEYCPSLKEVMTFSIKNIYNHSSVVEIEMTGFHVMSFLLDLFVPAVLKNTLGGLNKMALKLIPAQFTEFEHTDSPYKKVMSIMDFISGMTDSYATEFYRKTTGIEISKHR